MLCQPLFTSCGAAEGRGADSHCEPAFSDSEIRRSPGGLDARLGANGNDASSPDPRLPTSRAQPAVSRLRPNPDHGHRWKRPRLQLDGYIRVAATRLCFQRRRQLRHASTDVDLSSTGSPAVPAGLHRLHISGHELAGNLSAQPLTLIVYPYKVNVQLFWTRYRIRISIPGSPPRTGGTKMWLCEFYWFSDHSVSGSAVS